MKFLDKMEQKYGKYAIRNLPAVIIALYVAGYLIYFLKPELLWYLMLSPQMILRGQVWRLITWLIIPPSSPGIFTVIMLYFYFSVGRDLERTWGAFRFNVYIISGILFTIIGAFLLYFIGHTEGYVSTFYINMSILLAMAFTYPDVVVLLSFLIPIKMKYLGVLYGVLIILSMFETDWAGRVSIVMSLLNFLLFFLSTRNINRYSPKEIHRRKEFKRNVQKVQPKGVTKHKCAICGRTELDGDHLEFRFCSKCDGNYEYCQDHLFTHQHVKKK